MDNIIYKMKMKRILFNLKNEETGAVLIIVTLLMVVFMILLALTLDIGTAYLSAGQLQKASDAAVYSAGRMLPVPVPVNQADTVAVAAVNAIKDSAINYAKLNGSSGLTRNDVVLGNIIQGNYTDIKVTSTMNVEMNFARVIGVNSINISRSAKSKLSPTSKTTGVAPLGILESELQDSIANNEVTHIVLKHGSGGDSTQGWFGVLDLDGTQGGGASAYELSLSNGFPDEIAVGDLMLKKNGNMVGDTFDGSTARYDGCTHFGALTGGPGCTVEQYDPSCPRIVKIVVYTDNGSNVKVTGFAAFVLEVPTNDGYIKGSFVKILTTGQGSGGSAGESSDYGLYSLMLSE